MSDDCTKTVRPVFLLLDGSADYTGNIISQLKQIITLRILHFHLMDQAMFIVIHVSLKIGTQLVAKIIASTSIDDNSSVMEFIFCIFKY